jgi:site-specific DNA recombinase
MEPTDPESPSSIITEGMLEVIAEWYSANLAQEVRKGNNKSAQTGRWQGGWLKYGYTVNRDLPEGDKFHEVEEKEAAALLTMFQKIDGGMKLRQLAKWLYEEGVPSKQGGTWTAQHLSNLLRDKTYIGEGSYGKKTLKGDHFVKSDKIVPVPFPKIIPRDLFERVQVKLSENSRKNSGGAKHFYLLQHFGKCGECGGTVLCRTSKGYQYLHCSHQTTSPHIYQCYRPKLWPMGMIEDWVWNEVDEVLSQYVNGSYDSLIEQFENGQDDRQQAMDKASNKIKCCDTERQRILTVMRKGYITEADAEIQLISINADEKHWQQELTHYEQLQADSAIVWQAFMSQLHELDRFRFFGFHNLSAEQKKLILNTLLKEFVLYRDGKVELRLRTPLDKKQVADTVLSLSQHEQP